MQMHCRQVLKKKVDRISKILGQSKRIVFFHILIDFNLFCVVSLRGVDELNAICTLMQQLH